MKRARSRTRSTQCDRRGENVREIQSIKAKLRDMHLISLAADGEALQITELREHVLQRRGLDVCLHRHVKLRLPLGDELRAREGGLEPMRPTLPHMEAMLT